MESKSKLFGHASHQLLIVFPLGLLMTGVVYDLLARGKKKADRAKIAQTLFGAGVLTGLIAAVPGWIDWSAIPAKTRAKRVGLTHGVGNVVVLNLFALSWLLRRGDVENPSKTARTLAISGFLLQSVTAWLGGEMVDRLGIGVDEGAHPDAPSSLSGQKTRGVFGSR